MANKICYIEMELRLKDGELDPVGDIGHDAPMRHFFLWFCVLVMLAGAAWAQHRLDLVPGQESSADPPAAQDGYRLSVGGRVVMRIYPLSDDQAQVRDFYGAAREITLPQVKPYQPPVDAFAWPAMPPKPRFSLSSFATLYDGLSILLTDSANSGGRFDATLHMRTAAGRVGHCTVEVIRRGGRHPDRTLDAMIEKFLAKGPLPPLTGGEALVRLSLAVVPGNRPLMTVWVSAPQPIDEPDFTSLYEGVLYQEPLGHPPVVLQSEAARPVLIAYQKDRRRAAEHLRSLVNSESNEPLFGNWSIDCSATLAELERTLPAVTVGEEDPLLFLAAWAHVHQRREERAIAWMSEAALGSPVRSLAEEAHFLARAWRGGRALFDCRDDLPAPQHGAYSQERFLCRPAYGELAEQYCAYRLFIDELAAGENRRADQDLILGSAVSRLAHILARAVADRPPGEVARLARQFTPAGQEFNDRILFEAGILSIWDRRADAALELFRWSLEQQPTSPLAPEMAWRMVRAHLIAGHEEDAWDLAQAIENQFGPGSRWHALRGSTAQAAPWAMGVGDRVRGGDEIRSRALRLIREFALSKAAAGDAGWLAQAEWAARRLLDTTNSTTDWRADWTALGHILFLAGKRNQAVAAYANAALSQEEDALRRQALQGLAACLNPDMARVAAALREDAQLAPYVEPFLRVTAD